MNNERKNGQAQIAAQMLEKFLQEKKNHVYKNSVFVDLFSTDETAKENFLSLYNALHGTDDYPSEKTLRLSDAFVKNKLSENDVAPLEILVKVININTVKRSAVLGRRCNVLSDYSSFIDIVRHEKATGAYSRRNSHIRATTPACHVQKKQAVRITEFVGVLTCRYPYRPLIILYFCGA